MAKLILPEHWEGLDLSPCCAGGNVKRLSGPINPLVYSLNQIGINTYNGDAGRLSGPRRSKLPQAAWSYTPLYFPLEAGLRRVIDIHGFDWAIDSAENRFKFHVLTPRQMAFPKTEQGLLNARLQGIDLAVSILQDFGLKEDEAVESMRRYQEQLKTDSH